VQELQPFFMADWKLLPEVSRLPLGEATYIGDGIFFIYE
jgi:hypothetical protein